MEEDGFGSTSLADDAELRRTNNQSATTRSTRDVPSLYDEDHYALPNVIEGPSPPSSPTPASGTENVTVPVPKKNIGGTSFWILKCTRKRWATITMIAIGVLAVAAVGTYFFAESKGNIMDMYAFVIIM